MSGPWCSLPRALSRGFRAVLKAAPHRPPHPTALGVPGVPVVPKAVTQPQMAPGTRGPRGPCPAALAQGSPPWPVFQIILVGSSLSDRDQGLFLSTDEGATFQGQLVPFAVETLIFHPKEEDKVLAYTKDSKVSRPGWASGGKEGFCSWGPGPPPPAGGRSEGRTGSTQLLGLLPSACPCTPATGPSSTSGTFHTPSHSCVHQGAHGHRPRADG